MKRQLLFAGFLLGWVPGLASAHEYTRGPVPRGLAPIFRASFDHEGKTAPGLPKAEAGAGGLALARSNRSVAYPNWELVFTEGRFGKALDLRPESQKVYEARRYGGPGTYMTARAQGNVCLPCGTISVWMRSARQPIDLIIGTQSNDEYRPQPFLQISGGAGALSILRTARDQARLKSSVSNINLIDDTWHHLAFTWRVETGMACYLDGQPLKMEGAHGPWQSGYLSAGDIALAGEMFDELAIYDHVMSDGEVSLLAQSGVAGERDLDRLLAEVRARPSAPGLDRAAAPPVGLRFNEQYRLERLGWTKPDEGRFIPADGSHITRMDLSDARALRMSGWRAVDGRQDNVWPLRYHGYATFDGGGLHLKIARDQPGGFNVLRVAGDFNEAELYEGDSWQKPTDAASLLKFTGGSFLKQYRLPKSCQTADLTIYKQQKLNHYLGKQHALHDLTLLNVWKPASPMEMSHGRSFRLSNEEPGTVSGVNRVRLVNWYPPAERRVFLAKRGPGSAVESPDDKPVAAIQALEPFHIMLPAHEQDSTLDSVWVDLNVPEWTAGNTINVRLHDPFNLWRELIDVDVEMKSPGKLGVYLHFPATILPAGTELWLTITSRQPGRALGSSRVRHGGAMGSSESYLTWQHRLLKDTFAAISEGRPWHFNDFTNDVMHRVAITQYDAVGRLMWDLHRRFPGDRWTQGYMLFTHPGESAYWKQLPIELPRDEAAPRWALLQKELLGQFYAFIDWWIDHRQLPNGELGNGWNDDTDLLGDWISLALVSDHDGRIKRSQRLAADWTWANLNRDGLNLEEKGTLHAYEDGINVNSFAALLDYGNPILMERMMATARRYDGFLLTPAQNGQRKLATNWFDTARAQVRPDNNWHFGYYILHPGFNLVWYGGNPTLRTMFTELFDGMPPAFDELPGLPQLLFAQTGDARFVNAYKDTDINPVWVRLLNPKQLDAEKLQALIDFDVDVSRTGELGNQNMLPLKKYLAWRFTGDKQHLVRALEALYKQTYYTLPVYTRSEQSGDRVHLHKNLSDFMYTGGLPGARAQNPPMMAVSYEGLSRNFAALVLEDTSETLRWVGYSFENSPMRGALRVWDLVPGTYEVRSGVDGDGDDRIDGEAKAVRMELKRYETIPIALPTGKLFIVEARCVKKDVALHDRCDLAVTHEDALRQGDTLTVVAHNLGCKPTGLFTVEILDAVGKVRDSAKHEGLEGTADLQPKTAEFSFGKLPAGGVLTVRVLGPAKEITESNNEARIGK
jgi:hypothetical protein